jgi:hypothetical protein
MDPVIAAIRPLVLLDKRTINVKGKSESRRGKAGQRECEGEAEETGGVGGGEVEWS